MDIGSEHVIAWIKHEMMLCFDRGAYLELQRKLAWYRNRQLEAF